MYFIYSILYTIAFLLLLPVFFLNRQKYAAGFRQRLGNYPQFEHDERPVIWLHCVSVGETNAARPLVDALRSNFPSHRVVISTTTRTGQELARNIFKDKADAVFYFSFDWKFSVRRALENYKPSLVLLMETEIWPRFIHETTKSGAKIAIVNGRLSTNSFRRYSRIRGPISRVLAKIDLALMQDEKDVERIKALGMPESRTAITGNLKLDQAVAETDSVLTEEFRSRFGISTSKPLIIAASTHEPEERYVLEALDGELGRTCRLLIAPRHPERFDAVNKLLRESGFSVAKRSLPSTGSDKTADVILLDSIGELRAAYPLAEIVFVGGSLIPHGGQNVLEPAAFGKAIITGPYTHNFAAVVEEFLDHQALRQMPESPDDRRTAECLKREFKQLLNDPEFRAKLGRNAAAAMGRSNRGATKRTIEAIAKLIDTNPAVRDRLSATSRTMPR